MSLPVDPLAGYFFDTTDPSKLLKAGDVPAEAGDELTKWVSRDGTVTLAAVGAPTLQEKPYSSYPVVNFDGTDDGFFVDDASAPLDNQSEGGVFAGFRNIAGTGALPRIVVSIASSSTTSRQAAFGTYYNSAPTGLGNTLHGGSVDAYTSRNEASQFGAFTRAMWYCDGSEYDWRGSNGLSYPVTVNGSTEFIPYDASFPKRRFTIGYEGISGGGRSFWNGDISYAGVFGAMTEPEKLSLESWAETYYPTRSFLLVGDSRFNTTINDTLAAELNANVHENATGGYTIAQVQTAAESILDGDALFTHAAVLCGVNDFITGGATVAEAQSDMVALVEYLKTKVGTVLLVDELPCRGGSGVTETEYLRNSQFSSWIRGRNWGSGVRVVEAYESLEDPSNSDAYLPAYTSDNIHPNTTGEAVLVGLIAAAVAADSPPGISGDAVAKTTARATAIVTAKHAAA